MQTAHVIRASEFYDQAANKVEALRLAIRMAEIAGSTVYVEPGQYQLDEPLRLTSTCGLTGSGWETKMGWTAADGGPWRKDGDPTGGTWFVVNKPGMPAIEVTGMGVSVSKIAFRFEQPDPLQPKWLPRLDYGYAVDIQNTSDVELEDLFLYNATRGIRIGGDRSSGRVSMDRIYGQPLLEGIFLEHVTDVVKINDVHFWPFWAANANPEDTIGALWKVTDYVRQNGVAIRCQAVDNPQLSNIFAFRYNTGILLERNIQGFCTHRLLASNVNFDYIYGDGIRFQNVGLLPSAQISNYNYFGDYVGSGNTGVMVMGCSQVRLQMSLPNIINCRGNAIRMDGSNHDCMAQLDGLYAAQWNGPGFGFPAVEIGPGNRAKLSKSCAFEKPYNGNPPATGGGGIIE